MTHTEGREQTKFKGYLYLASRAGMAMEMGMENRKMTVLHLMIMPGEECDVVTPTT